VDRVFVVQHVAREGEEAEDVEFIAAYSTRANAEAAVQRLRAQAGFRDFPDAFYVDEYPLDKDHWTDGFTTVT
jgi:hypothetical protein